jgi:hypothetical protein
MMKNYTTRAITVMGALLLVAASVTAQQATTVEGTLVDAKCYLGDNMAIGNDHGAMKACGTMCLKGGSTAGVICRFGSPIAASSMVTPCRLLIPSTNEPPGVAVR